MIDKILHVRHWNSTQLASFLFKSQNSTYFGVVFSSTPIPPSLRFGIFPLFPQSLPWSIASTSAVSLSDVLKCCNLQLKTKNKLSAYMRTNTVEPQTHHLNTTELHHTTKNNKLTKLWTCTPPTCSFFWTNLQPQDNIENTKSSQVYQKTRFCLNATNNKHFKQPKQQNKKQPKKKTTKTTKQKQTTNSPSQIYHQLFRPSRVGATSYWSACYRPIATRHSSVGLAWKCRSCYLWRSSTCGESWNRAG